MAFELSQQNTMASLIYDALGQSVTYTGTVDGAVSIKVILNRQDEEFPGDFGGVVIDGDASVRVLVSDVPNPRRGDTITDANSVVFTVDEYRRAPDQAEWRMELKE